MNYSRSGLNFEDFLPKPSGPMFCINKSTRMPDYHLYDIYSSHILDLVCIYRYALKAIAYVARYTDEEFLSQIFPPKQQH